MTRRIAVLLVLISTVALAGWTQESHSHMVISTAGLGWRELIGSMERMHVATVSIEPSGDLIPREIIVAYATLKRADGR